MAISDRKKQKGHYETNSNYTTTNMVDDQIEY